MDVTAKIVKMMDSITGEGKNGNKWTKREIIVETIEDQYPRKVCIGFWGDKCNEISKYNIDDVLKIHINIESREYNNRWYTDVKAWKIEVVSESGVTKSNNSNVTVNTNYDEYSQNFNTISNNDGGEKYNDLPF